MGIRASMPLDLPPAAVRRGDPALLVRHVAILLASVAAILLFQRDPDKSRVVIWILGGAALLNFAAFCMSLRRPLSGAAHHASPILGVTSWTTLVYFTGGSASPYSPGLALEIFLTAATFGPVATALVSVGAAAALWIQQVPHGFAVGSATALALQTALLLVIGGVATFVRCRWGWAQSELRDEAARSRERLRVLEEELEDLRAVGQVGENVARLAHALKNAVGALKGFTRLIETRVPEATGGRGMPLETGEDMTRGHGMALGARDNVTRGVDEIDGRGLPLGTGEGVLPGLGIPIDTGVDVASSGEGRLDEGLRPAACSGGGPISIRVSDDDGILEGLRCAVDRLEEISRLLLEPTPGPVSREDHAGHASSPAGAGGGLGGDLSEDAGIEAVIEHAIAEASTKHPGIRWTRSEAGALTHTGGAPAPLSEVLGVLLDNAAEAMTGRGEVSIAARESEGRLEIEVKDGGCGIAPWRLDDLFRAGRTTKPQGSGFGLFLARRLVEARGGTITFSAAPGGGASFGVVLPLQDASR